MNTSQVVGILSALMLVFAFLSVALPVASVATGLSISANQTSAGGLPTVLKVTNRGFMPVDNVYLSVVTLSSNGTRISSVNLGPIDILTGASVPLDINESVYGVPSSTGYRVVATAGANLGGILPISVSANFTISAGNGTAPGSLG